MMKKKLKLSINLSPKGGHMSITNTTQMIFAFCALLLLTSGQMTVSASPATQANSQDRNALVVNSFGNDSFYSVESYSEIIVELSKIISIESLDTTRKEVLDEIAEKANLGVAYNSDLEFLKESITIEDPMISVGDALMMVLDGTGFHPVISRTREIVLYRNEEETVENPEGASEDLFQETIRGTVTDAQTGETLPGVNILIEGSSTGTTTDLDGNFELSVPSLEEILIFTFIGYERQEVSINGRSELIVELSTDIISGDEVVVVGYGVQMRSDITGSVTSVPQERFDMVPNQNITQAIQGAVPGVMVQTSSAGASPSENLMVRGRNSITADNAPLIVIDGIPYDGNVMDINPNDVQAIEVLKDASAAAIYGSRGSNGVILITTQTGIEGRARISYDSKFSTQRYTNRVEVMDGEEFYNFKQRAIEAGAEPFTQTELQNYEDGNWTNYPELALRDGFSQEHSLSVSGASEDINYFISGNILDVQGLLIKDEFMRLSGSVNLDIDFSQWLTVGTRTRLSYIDQSGTPPEFSNFHYGLIYGNPLLNTFEDDGITPTVYIWPENTSWRNPLRQTTYENNDETNQFLTNNFIEIDVPFVAGLNNRINTGIRRNFVDFAEYRGRDSYEGEIVDGEAFFRESRDQNIILENVLTYNNDFRSHNIFATGVISYERNTSTSTDTEANRFPNDLLGWYGLAQAENIQINNDFLETTLLSQMFRLNYSYDSRYLITLTTRRDGFSGFGDNTKWGTFPSFALGWNFHNEDFFPWSNIFNELKPRISYGVNGNQAIDAYRTTARLISRDLVSLGATQPGFGPGTLGNETLGWETSRTLNLGIDFAIFDDRISGGLNLYHTHTSDLLLDRSISPVHGITSTVQNIGETQNQGLEISFHSRNITTPSFLWSTSGNVSFNRNEIVELYGDGEDDVASQWFIGQPINVNYDYVFDGIWQEEEADEAAQWGSQPGFVKLRDVNEDGELTSEDRQIIGQQDPKFMWGMNNTFYYRSFSLDVFIHGVHGATNPNMVNQRYISTSVNNNFVAHNWWAPDHPTNEMWSALPEAHVMDGIEAKIFDDASFVRIKDVTLSYDIPDTFMQKVGIDRLRLYVTGRNLFTFTSWPNLDPELSSDYGIPLQREFVFGINLEL